MHARQRTVLILTAGFTVAAALEACGATETPSLYGAGGTGHGAAADGGAGTTDTDASAATDGGGGIAFGDGADDKPNTCLQDADCDVHDPCTSFACAAEGEFKRCVYTPVHGPACEIADAGADVGLPPVDPLCTSAGQPKGAVIYPPFVPLATPSVPASCASGFALGDARPGAKYVLDAKTAAGAAAITLDVDFATYMEPDGVVVTGVDGSGASYVLLDTCRLRTWNQVDPTGGLSRPPDVAIRQFRIDVRAGTKSLTFDFAGVTSPMYLQVLGLCDFDVPSTPNARSWSAIP